MYDPAKAERKKEKQIANIMWRSVGAAGVGIGLFLLRFIVAPFLGENEKALDAIATFSLCLIGFGGLMIVVFICKRDWLTRVYPLMAWFVLPIILLKLLAGIF